MAKINIKGPIISNNDKWLYNYFGMDSACPNDITKALEEANGEDVVIEINSPGGICVSGFEMYKAIKDYQGKVTAHIISAVSAATMPMCAADEVLISDAGIIMIHNAANWTEGDYRDMQEEADALKEFNNAIINAYMNKTGLTHQKLQNLMDKTTFMAAEKAIEYGFADGYIYEQRDTEEGDEGKKINFAQTVANYVQNVAASTTPVLTGAKAEELRKAIALIEGGLSPDNVVKNIEPIRPEESELSGVQDAEENTVQNIGGEANSDISNEGGSKMSLKELLEANPEAKAEVDVLVENARLAGVKEENERMQSLDSISVNVTPEALNEAKYGEDKVDGKELAYRAMLDDQKRAKAYMAEAIQDSEDSNANEVTVGNPDAGEQTVDESDAMAGYINEKKKEAK